MCSPNRYMFRGILLQFFCANSGARVAEADAAARQAAEMRAYKADEEIIALKAALKEELESHFNSKNLIARLERESNQFASQQESMVLEHQALCKQLEEHAKLLEDKVCCPLLEACCPECCFIMSQSRLSI